MYETLLIIVKFTLKNTAFYKENKSHYAFLTSANASAKSLERSMTGRSRAATMRTLIFAGILRSLYHTRNKQLFKFTVTSVTDLHKPQKCSFPGAAIISE